MAFVEFKEPEKKVPYKDIKECTFRRELGEPTSDKCKQVFRDAKVYDQ